LSIFKLTEFDFKRRIKMANTFDWIEIKTHNIEETANFYENLFGWKIIEKETAEGLDVWIFDTGGTPRLQNLQRGSIWLRPANETPGIIVYIVVNNIDSTLNKVVGLGGKIVTPKTLQGPHFRACCTDPGGNLFGLWEETN
jgi:predicted enzyme related to lactoylglutathione lyase